MQIPEAVPCKHSSGSFTGALAWWVCVRIIKPRLEQVSLPRRAQPLHGLATSSNVLQKIQHGHGGCCEASAPLGGLSWAPEGISQMGVCYCVCQRDADTGCKQNSHCEWGIGLVRAQLPSLSYSTFQAERQKQRCSACEPWQCCGDLVSSGYLLKLGGSPLLGLDLLIQEVL